jgi:hypothetical protein
MLPLLLACTSPASQLQLPPLPTAGYAEALPVAKLLTPSALGASSDILCPWARGEEIPDASLARWVAERRLVWRVADVAAGTFAGEPLANAAEVQAQADALAKRCGAELGRDVLIVAGGATPYGDVAKVVQALANLRYEDPWLAVADVPSSIAAPAAPRAGSVPTPEAATPATGTPAMDLRAALRTPSPCTLVSAAESATWVSVVSRVAQARAAGADVVLGIEAGGPASGPASPSGADSELAPIAVGGSVGAVRMSSPRYGGCGVADSGGAERAPGDGEVPLDADDAPPNVAPVTPQQ